MSQSSSPGPDAVVTLRSVTSDNLSEVLRLKVAPQQEQFVASNAVSLAQAHFTKEAWFRAIYADETPIGFMMLYEDRVKPEYFLWRLLIDQRYQRYGFGRQAMARLIEYVKTLPNAAELLLSHGEGEGSPAPFYARLGFTYTGNKLDDELVMRLPVQADSATLPAPSPLTHVVMFKLRERTPAEAERLAQLLRSMDGQIPPLRGIEVGVNIVESARAYDLVLITRFNSLADMETYQVHPLHQSVSAQMRAASEAVAAVDFEER